MRFWRALRDRPDELGAAISTTPYSRAEWHMCREQHDAVDDVEAARRSWSGSTSRSAARAPAAHRRRPGLTAAAAPAGVRADLPDKLAADRLAGVALEHRPNRTSAPSPMQSRGARRSERKSNRPERRKRVLVIGRRRSYRSFREGRAAPLMSTHSSS